MSAIKAVVVFGMGYIPAFDAMVTARTAQARSDEPWVRTEAHAKVLDGFTQVTEATVLSGEIPDSVSVGPASVSIFQQAAAWVNGLFSDAPTKDDDTKGRIDPDAETVCDAVTNAIRSCEQANWATEPCRLMLDKIKNPNCDPTVALTDGDRACAKTDPSDVEIQEGLERADIRCWSVINPGSDGHNVCAAALPTGRLAYFSSPRAVCGNPNVMIDADQCAPIIRQPGEVAAILLGSGVNPIRMTMAQPRPPRPAPGPE